MGQQCIDQGTIGMPCCRVNHQPGGFFEHDDGLAYRRPAHAKALGRLALQTGDTVIRMVTPSGSQGQEICVRLDDEYNGKGVLVMNILNGHADLRVGNLVVTLDFEMRGLVMESSPADPRTCREYMPPPR